MDSSVPTPQNQAAEVKKLVKTYGKELKDGDVLCYVSRKWFELWINYTKCDAFWEIKPEEKSDGLEPGEMDNTGLLREFKGKFPMSEIRRDLQQIRDYFTVPEPVYNKLEEWYHGGPKISRVARKIAVNSTEPKVQVVKYPVSLALIESDKEGKPDFSTAIVKEFTPSDTLKTVKDFVINSMEQEAVRSKLDKLEVKGSAIKGEEGSQPAPAATAEADAGAPKGEDENTTTNEEIEDESKTKEEKESKQKFRMWIPEKQEGKEMKSLGVVAEDPEDETATAEEVKWTMLQKIQDDMELGQFQFAPGVTMILLEKPVDGKWPREGADWRSFKVGDKVDVLDTISNWLTSTVKEVEEKRILIHYDGYSSTWDEWIEIDSDRLAKAKTKAGTSERSGGYYSSSSSYYSGSEGTPKQKGIVGLRNLGNTCFMNSTLQCMTQTPWLTDFFKADEHVSQLNRDNPLGKNGKIAEEYGDLIKKIWSNKYTVVAPSAFKHVIGEFAPQFSGYQQQDSQELLSFLVDGLHEDLNRLKKKGYNPDPIVSKGKSDVELAEETWERHKLRHDSAILDNMGGMFRSIVVAPCGTEYRKFDPFLLTFPVPLPNSNKKQQTVTVVFADTTKQPTKYQVNFSKGGDVGELKQAIAAKAELKTEHLVVAEVFSQKIFRTYESKDSADRIMPRDVIYAFECPALTDAKDPVTVPVYHVKDNGVEFGTPRMVVLPSVCTAKEAKTAVKAALASFVRKDAKKPDSPYSITFGARRGSSEDEIDVSDPANETKELSLEGRQYIFQCNWGETSDIESNHCKEMVIDDESVESSGRGKKGKGGVTLEACIEAFTKQESLKKGNEFYCKNCKDHVLVTKKMDVWKLPNIMVIQLKRFTYTSTYREKIGTFVDFPLEGLNLAKHTLSEEDKKNAIYDLYAVSCHGGGLGGGHYWAYVKSLKDGNWYNMNDSSTSPMDKSMVKTSEAYLLFYVRRGFGKKSASVASTKTEDVTGKKDK